MPVYRRQWWPEHHAANIAWIRGQLDALKKYEAVFAKRLADAYGGEWPVERVRVDATAYANWTGAYTTNHPDQVTISSTGYKGLEGLEMLFHEVPTQVFLKQRILGQLAEAFRAQGSDLPNRLFHTIQFVTPAELLRSLLSGEELDRFQSVAESVEALDRIAAEFATASAAAEP